MNPAPQPKAMQTDAVLEREDAGEVSGREWLAVYTVVRHEIKVEGLLRRLGITPFLPRRTVRRQWKDRRVNVSLPLFPGYLFVHIPLEDRFRVLNVPGVVRILSGKGEPIPIPAEQIDAIRTLVESDLAYDPIDYFPHGREVTVTSGPLRGVQGRVVDHRGRQRLILSADFIQRSVSVQVDIHDVELT